MFVIYYYDPSFIAIVITMNSMMISPLFSEEG